MSNMIAVGFPGEHRAAEVLDQLLHLQERSWFELEDAVAVRRTRRGHLRVEHSLTPTSLQGAAFGAAIGAILGAIVAAPLTLAATAGIGATAVALNAGLGGIVGGGVGAEDARIDKNDHGISEETVKKIGKMLTPGSSALFLLGRAVDPKAVAEHFRGYGGKVEYSTFSLQKTAQIQRIIRA
jgi:uncharacterized membrane protein